MNQMDVQAIIDLAVHYAVAVDARDWESFRSCFTPTASGDYSVHVPTYADLEANARRLEGTDMTHHALTNFQVRAEGDTATQNCHMVAFHYRAGADEGETYTIRGMYRDQLVRTDDGWRINYRRLDQWNREGNPAVIPPPLSKNRRDRCLRDRQQRHGCLHMKRGADRHVT